MHYQNFRWFLDSLHYKLHTFQIGYSDKRLWPANINFQKWYFRCNLVIYAFSINTTCDVCCSYRNCSFGLRVSWKTCNCNQLCGPFTQYYSYHYIRCRLFTHLYSRLSNALYERSTSSSVSKFYFFESQFHHACCFLISSSERAGLWFYLTSNFLWPVINFFKDTYLVNAYLEF